MVEVANGEQLEPNAQVWFDIVHQFKWSIEFTVKVARDLIKHEHRVTDSVVSLCVSGLCLGDVGASYLDHLRVLLQISLLSRLMRKVLGRPFASPQNCLRVVVMTKKVNNVRP